MSDATQALAATLAAEALSIAAGSGDEQAAAALHREAEAERVAAEPVVPSQPTHIAKATDLPDTAATPTVEIPEVDLDFKPRLNDDLQALLDEPDFDEEASLEVAAELEDGDYEYGDPEVAKQLRSLQKRNAHLESQLVAKSRKGWVAENLRAYPLLDKYAADQVQAIAATSRRAFAREAAKLNATYEKALAPALEEIAKAKAALKQQVVTEARDEVKRAWGTPAGDTLPAPAAEAQERLANARKTGKLRDSLKVMLEEKPL